MLDQSEEREIVDYIMNGLPQRLDIAVAIHSAFEEIRREVIKKFARELSVAVERELLVESGWHVDAAKLLDDPLGKNVGLIVRQAAWDEAVSVRMWADNYGPRDWWLGVQTPKMYWRFDSVRSHLMAILGDPFYADEAEFPWWRKFEGKWGHWTLADWRNSSAVLALGRGTGGDYGEYLCRSLVELALATDSAFSSDLKSPV